MTGYFNKPADQLGIEQIRQYQIYLVSEKKVSWSSFNQAVCALRFLYEVSLAKPWAVRHIPFGKRPKTLPTVLSDQEVTRLIECVANLKHRTVLLVCYAAGLRLAEATHLKVAEIDGKRAQILVSLGKGSKARTVPASPRLLDKLRHYWKLHRPRNFLFPSKIPETPLSSTTIRRPAHAPLRLTAASSCGVGPCIFFPKATHDLAHTAGIIPARRPTI